MESERNEQKVVNKQRSAAADSVWKWSLSVRCQAMSIGHDLLVRFPAIALDVWMHNTYLTLMHAQSGRTTCSSSAFYLVVWREGNDP